LGIGNDTSVDSIKQSGWETARSDILSAAKGLLQSSNDNDVAKGQRLLELEEISDPIEAFERYWAELTTQSGSVVASFATTKAPENVQAFFGRPRGDKGTEIIRLNQIHYSILRSRIFNLTEAVFHLSGRYIELYETEKRLKRVLDFNDQINLVNRLLSESEHSAWVLYKLDYGVHHILVDEAQDTAPAQWSIIDSIRDGFDVTDPDDILQEVKTFFAVGDEKQSIYSFQGARPEEFMKRIRDASEEDAKSVRMEMSFRSAPEILRVVDAVFRDKDAQSRMFNADIVSTIEDDIQHFAHREDTGLVEIWPLAPWPDDGNEKEAWDTTPVDMGAKSSSREQLAAAVASQVKQWLETGELIFDRDESKTRPMRPEDILILVRGRSDFFDGVIRNLKEKGVPVAGADRLVISEALIVQDMLALTRFVLLPSDDLSLAEVLKGPLFDFSDKDVFDLCIDRENSTLWSCLKSSGSQKYRTATARLEKIVTYARQYAPFEFYRRVLDMMDDNGESHLKLLYRRLSLEAQDALEAFLNKALAHQREGAPSLQHFLELMMGDKQDIKREMDGAQGEVRVMTVHGSKGLEAPVVILPDTTQTPGVRNSDQLLPCDEGFVYLSNKTSVPPELNEVWTAEEDRVRQEFLRLLYVAMTRAESRLLVCGYSVRKADGRDKGCWYDEIKDALSDLKTHERSHFEADWDNILVYGGRAQPSDWKPKSSENEEAQLPDWAFDKAEKELPSQRKVTPSHLLVSGQYADMPVRSPLSQSVDRFRRGNLTHKLLEILPELPVERRRQAAQDFLSQYQDLSVGFQKSIENEVMNVLENPDFAPFFAPGSRAEVNMAGRGAGLPADLYLNAQIDRLAVTSDTVYIVDYKSNRPPPVSVADVPDIYWGQMAAYREMVRLTHPDHQIICALLWTDGPELMILSDEGLDSALTQIRSLPT